MARKAGSRSDITEPLIREVATELFARHGYDGVSMRQLAAKVGVRAGAIYIYFEDKQALLQALIDAHLDGRLANWENAGATGAPTPRLRAFLGHHLNFNGEYAAAAAIAANDIRSLSSEGQLRAAAKRRAYVAELQGILDAGVEKGVFEIADTSIAAHAILTLLDGSGPIFSDPARNPRQSRRALWQLVLRMVAAPRVGAQTEDA